MNAIRNLLQSACRVVGFGSEIIGYAVSFGRSLFTPKAVLAARLLAAESQLAVCTQRIEDKKAPRPGFSAAFRVLWVLLSKLFVGWERCACLMQPATVKRWHTTAFRVLWRWRSRRKPGRPPISDEMQELIRRLSQENALWTARKIRDTLKLQGYEPPCADTIRKYMIKRRGGPGRKGSTTWLPFLRNHLDVSWGMDFLTVPTLSLARLYVFLVIEHGRR